MSRCQERIGVFFAEAIVFVVAAVRNVGGMKRRGIKSGSYSSSLERARHLVETPPCDGEVSGRPARGMLVTKTVRATQAVLKANTHDIA